VPDLLPVFRTKDGCYQRTVIRHPYFSFTVAFLDLKNWNLFKGDVNHMLGHFFLARPYFQLLRLLNKLNTTNFFLCSFPSGSIKPVFFFCRRCPGWVKLLLTISNSIFDLFSVISLDQFQRKNHNITDTFRPDQFVLCLSLWATQRCYIQWNYIQHAVRLLCLDKNVRGYTWNLAVWNWECLVSWGEIYRPRLRYIFLLSSDPLPSLDSMSFNTDIHRDIAR